jgi:hypothetical protein
LRVIVSDASAPAPHITSCKGGVFTLPRTIITRVNCGQGEREVDAFIKYIAREASTPLKTFDRDGKKIKTKKSKVDL